MPEIRPLRPIIHWRSGKPAIVTALVLKTQFLRQFDWLAGVCERKGSLTRGQRADAGDDRPCW